VPLTPKPRRRPPALPPPPPPGSLSAAHNGWPYPRSAGFPSRASSCSARQVGGTVGLRGEGVAWRRDGAD